MDRGYIIEGIGYLGSMLVVVSMLMTSVKKLRIVNTTGSIIFTVYALIIRSYPTAFMNMCLIMINIYQLIKLGRSKQNLMLVKGRTDMGAVPYLLDYYIDDIRKFFPDVDRLHLSGCDTAYLVTYETTPAGILLGNMKDDGSLEIWLDYAAPAYRDCSVGKFLYERLPEEGIKRVRFSGKSAGHEEYMLKMGFEKTDEGYVKELM